MLDFLWAGMLILGTVWGLMRGRGAQLTQAVLDSGRDAVSLGMTMLGVMTVWTGLMEVGKAAGFLRQLNRLLAPAVRWLFPDLPEGHPAAESISANFAANLLGLGNAATPTALRAMKDLQTLPGDRGTASNAMCTFLILNISSLQLIPMSMIAYRSRYGSANPAAIVGPSIAATAVSTAAAVIFCKIMDRKRRA